MYNGSFFILSMIDQRCKMVSTFSRCFTCLSLQEEARHTIANVLDTVDFHNIETIVRVNSVDSGLAEEDLSVTLSAQRLPPTIMLPKVENPGQLDWVRWEFFTSILYIE